MRSIPVVLVALLALPVDGLQDPAARHEAYQKVIAATERMVADADLQQRLAKQGLQALNVTWEDTGRYKNSAVGPNISDMTIQVQSLNPKDEKFSLHCMPVIRFPNFEDKSADLSPDKFQLLVGNETGGPLRRVTLREYLGNIRKYLHQPGSWKGDFASLLADRDTHVLVSAQACFLPIPKEGLAEFNPVLFNYQSYEGDPAVLTILCTREGTSATVIDNKRDAFQAGATWGQRLFFNQKGQRASLTGRRKSDFLADPKTKPSEPVTAPEANEQGGLNMVLLIQVPLLQKNPRLGLMEDAESFDGGGEKSGGAPRGHRVEDAVIGHGKVEGPYTEIGGLEVRRDARFPVRVTVQFYKATEDGQVTPGDIEDIKKQIDKVYAQADYVGSLVTQGHTGRPTEYEGDKVEPAGWWAAFWKLHEENTGQSRSDTMIMLRKLLGPGWAPRSGEELAEAVRKLDKK